MTEPLVALDARFSDPEAVAVPWEETRRALEDAELFWISTVRRDGRPHATPLVAVWLDDAMHFCTGPTEQKALNLAHNAHVVLTTGCNSWDRGLDVVVEGTAVRVVEHDRLARLSEAWGAKWDGRWKFEVADGAFHHSDGGEALVFAVTPAKVLAFGKGTFSQSTYKV